MRFNVRGPRGLNLNELEHMRSNGGCRHVNSEDISGVVQGADVRQ